MLLGLLVHALAGVGDGQSDKLTGTDTDMGFAVVLIQDRIPAVYDQLAPIRHGISGIDAKIHDHLLDLDRITVDDFGLFIYTRFDCNHLGNRSFQQLFQL